MVDPGARTRSGDGPPSPSPAAAPSRTAAIWHCPPSATPPHSTADPAAAILQRRYQRRHPSSPNPSIMVEWAFNKAETVARGGHLLRQPHPHLPSRIPPCGHRRVAQTIRKHGPTGLLRVPNGSVSRAVSEVPAGPRCPRSLRRATPTAVPHWCSCRRPFGCGDGRKYFDGLDPRGVVE